MMHYKHKLTQMWKQESPTSAELLDVIADFCDDLGNRRELSPDIYDMAGKIFACIGMLEKLEAETKLQSMAANNQDDAIADLQMRVEVLEEAQKLREGEI